MKKSLITSAEFSLGAHVGRYIFWRCDLLSSGVKTKGLTLIHEIQIGLHQMKLNLRAIRIFSKYSDR